MLGIEDRKALQQFSRVRDVDVAVEIGKGIIDAGALAAGLLLTGPAGVIAGLGIETLAIGLCVEHGDDEEAIARTVGVIAGTSFGALGKYGDEIVEMSADYSNYFLESVAKYNDDFADVFSIYLKKPVTKQSSKVGKVVSNVAKKVDDLADEVVDIADDVVDGGTDIGNIAKRLDTNNIPNMTKQDIIDSIPNDWNYTENNGFVHIRDADGNIRIRIDPPDKVTNYPHVHVYDSDGNLLDSVGNIVDRKSSDGHIPYKDD